MATRTKATPRIVTTPTIPTARTPEEHPMESMDVAKDLTLKVVNNNNHNHNHKMNADDNDHGTMNDHADEAATPITTMHQGAMRATDGSS
jgi:hypothetical protein